MIGQNTAHGQLRLALLTHTVSIAKTNLLFTVRDSVDINVEQYRVYLNTTLG